MEPVDMSHLVRLLTTPGSSSDDSCSRIRKLPEGVQTLYGVILPSEFLPDDTKLLYDLSGRPITDADLDDPDDELIADVRCHLHCANLALAYYNDKHDTDYKFVPVPGGKWCLDKGGNRAHVGFTASLITPVENESSIVSFFAVLNQKFQVEEEKLENYVVSSCIIANGKTSVGCRGCDTIMCRPYVQGWLDRELRRPKRWEEDPPVSDYANCVADGVSLSEKARLRLKYALCALKHYNKKYHKNYMMVDVLPFCVKFDGEFCDTYDGCFIVHCNFVAKLNPPAHDSSEKLFFAELNKKKKNWVVKVCRILRGKSTVGCHFCAGRNGRRVLHPTRYGFHASSSVFRRLRPRF